MKPRALLLSVRREYSPSARVLLALLAIIQLIAPTWHVCEMGGGPCCPPSDPQATMLHCARDKAATLSPPRCSKCPEDQASPSRAVDFVVTAPHHPYGGNCLAKLLLGMPWQSVAAQELFHSARFVSGHTAREYSFHFAFFGALPPSRAPPLHS